MQTQCTSYCQYTFKQKQKSMGNQIEITPALSSRTYAPNLTDYTPQGHFIGGSVWVSQEETIIQYTQQYENDKQLELFKKLFKYRYRHNALVSTAYAETLPDSKIRFYCEGIVGNLSHFQEIPFEDTPHFYSRAMKGFALLKQQFGCFQIKQDMFHINENYQLKVWHSERIDKMEIDPAILKDDSYEQTMVKSIMEILQENSDFCQSDTIKKRLSKFNISSFNVAIEAISKCCRRDNLIIRSTISCLKCFNKKQLRNFFASYIEMMKKQMALDVKIQSIESICRNKNLISIENKEPKQQLPITYQQIQNNQNDIVPVNNKNIADNNECKKQQSQQQTRPLSAQPKDNLKAQNNQQCIYRSNPMVNIIASRNQASNMKIQKITYEHPQQINKFTPIVRSSSAPKLVNNLKPTFINPVKVTFSYNQKPAQVIKKFITQPDRKHLEIHRRPVSKFQYNTPTPNQFIYTKENIQNKITNANINAESRFIMQETFQPKNINSHSQQHLFINTYPPKNNQYIEANKVPQSIHVHSPNIIRSIHQSDKNQNQNKEQVQKSVVIQYLKPNHVSNQSTRLKKVNALTYKNQRNNNFMEHKNEKNKNVIQQNKIQTTTNVFGQNNNFVQHKNQKSNNFIQRHNNFIQRKVQKSNNFNERKVAPQQFQQPNVKRTIFDNTFFSQSIAYLQPPSLYLSQNSASLQNAYPNRVAEKKNVIMVPTVPFQKIDLNKFQPKMDVISEQSEAKEAGVSSTKRWNKEQFDTVNSKPTSSTALLTDPALIRYLSCKNYQGKFSRPYSPKIKEFNPSPEHVRPINHGHEQHNLAQSIINQSWTDKRISGHSIKENNVFQNQHSKLIDTVYVQDTPLKQQNISPIYKNSFGNNIQEMKSRKQLFSQETIVSKGSYQEKIQYKYHFAQKQIKQSCNQLKQNSGHSKQKSQKNKPHLYTRQQFNTYNQLQRLKQAPKNHDNSIMKSKQCLQKQQKLHQYINTQFSGQQIFPSLNDISQNKSDNGSFMPMNSQKFSMILQKIGQNQEQNNIQNPNRKKYEPHISQRIMKDLLNLRRQSAV